MRSRSIAFGLLFCFCAYPRASAQPAADGIRGVVDDDTGAVIPGAHVILVEQETGRVREVPSNEAGRFQFEAVPPGPFQLIVEAEGFQTTAIQVVVGNQPLPDMRVRLKVGVSEEVTVTARRSPPRTAPERNMDSVRLSSEFLGQVPVDANNIVPLLENFLSPAAKGVGGMSVIVDGVETDALSLPTGDIKRISINRNPYAAEFRRPGQARVEIVTERGSFLHFHGGGALLIRNSAFDARNPFLPTKPKANREVFTTTVGGPLGARSRAFFASIEGASGHPLRVVNAHTLDGPVIIAVQTPEARLTSSARVDQRLPGEHTITGRYDLTAESDRNDGAGGLNLPEQITRTDHVHHGIQLIDRSIAGTALANELRLLVSREWLRSGVPASAPEILVRGAFIGGPSQVFRSDRVTRVEIQNAHSYFRGRHEVRFGAQLRSRFVRAVDQSNFGGTFEFSGLDDFASGRPFVFRRNLGDPNVQFGLHDAYGFIQDDFTAGRRVSVLIGARYDWQSRVNATANLEPRLGFAVAPERGGFVIRGGAGIFTERLPEQAVARSFLYDADHVQSLVISPPAFPNQDVGPRSVVTPSVVRIDSDVRTPKLMQASISIERPLWRGTQLAIDFETLRGWQLFRSRNVNAPLSDSTRRPNPDFLNIDEVESSANMRSSAMNMMLQTRVLKAFRGTFQYRWSLTTNDTGGVFSLPADNYNLAAESGRSDSDRRHLANVVGLLNLPARFRFAAVLTMKSGAPFDITTGRDDNRDTVASDRPQGVTRNTGHGPSFSQMDVRVTKVFRAPRPSTSADRTPDNLELAVDVFNAFDRTNAVGFVGVQTSPLFGRAVAAKDSRGCQLSVRYKF